VRHTNVDGDGPVFRNRRAPVTHKHAHDHAEGNDAVSRNKEHGNLPLAKGAGQAVVENEKTGFDGPDAGEGEDLEHKSHDAPVDGVIFFLWCKCRSHLRVHVVAAVDGHGVDRDHDSGEVGRCKNHQPVVDSQPPRADP